MTQDDSNGPKALEELVRRAGEGDHAAIAELYHRYEQSMVASVHKERGETLKGLVESVDLVQSVWKDVIEDLPAFEPRGPDSFPAWLHSCLRNKIRAKGRYHGAARRDVRRRVPLDSVAGPPPPPAVDPTPSQVVSRTEEQERLVAVLEALPPIQREVLTLRLSEDLPYAEIARRIHKSVAATKKIYGRSLERLIARMRS